jgi:hypothetical protein
MSQFHSGTVQRAGNFGHDRWVVDATELALHVGYGSENDQGVLLTVLDIDTRYILHSIWLPFQGGRSED